MKELFDIRTRLFSGSSAGANSHKGVSKGKPRIAQLDMLRLIAVLLVLGRHIDMCPTQQSELLSLLTSLWIRGGWIGVDLFFVLSGFLVSGLIFREYGKSGSVNLGRFLIRRGFKIYPPFWIFIAITIIVTSFEGKPIRGSAVIGELLFLQNYLPSLWGHSWSLAVEEHFYILLSLLVFSLLKVAKNRESTQPFRHIPAAFMIIALTCLCLRMFSLQIYPYINYNLQFYPTHLRIDSLMFGVLLSYYWNVTKSAKSIGLGAAYIMIASGMLLLTPAFIFSIEDNTWIPVLGFILFYCGSGLLLLGFLIVPFTKNKFIQSISAIGAYSYSIYLWHLPVHDWLTPMALKVFPEYLSSSWFLYASIYLSGSLIFGILLSKLTEGPILAFRDKLFPSSVSAVSSKS